MENQDFDVVIVGGGLVGCSLACALAPLGLAVGLVDAGAGPAPLDRDPRKLALGAASLQALRALGVLGRLAAPPSPRSGCAFCQSRCADPKSRASAIRRQKSAGSCGPSATRAAPVSVARSIISSGRDCAP